MADRIIIKTNDPSLPQAVPSPCELERGELSLNVNTGKLYALDASEPPLVREIGGCCSSGGGLYVGWIPFSITDVSLSHSSVEERNASGAVIGTLSATVSSGSPSVTYSLVRGTGDADNESFGISGASLLSAESFVFATKSSYSIRVRASAGDVHYEKQFVISITALPAVEITDILLSNSTIPNAAIATWPIGELSAVRLNIPDGTPVGYELVAGAGSADNGVFRLSGGTLVTGTAAATPVWAPGAQTSFHIRVRATSGSATYEKAFTLTRAEAPPDAQLDADFLVVRYKFLDGADLDTRTQLVINGINEVPNPSRVVGAVVGWNRGSEFRSGTNNAVLYRWGGDNTGRGFESVLIDIAAIRAAYPGFFFNGYCKAFWYSLRQSGNVWLSVTSYKGGVMHSDGPDFVNVGGRVTAEVSRTGNVLSTLNSGEREAGEGVSDFYFNSSGTLSWGEGNH
jgi:hypothetical protein